jgi:RNA polymerase sigma factor (sigma-70 family)
LLQSVTEPLKVWFAREILVHEAALLRYLNRCWPKKDEIHDLRQEIYVRIYEAAAKARPTSPKSFLFTTARHLMTDRLRRNRVVSIEAIGDFEALNVLVDEFSPERRLDARQELKRFARALNGLPRKCREVVWLRRVDDMPQKEVAARLGISERTVESHVLKGMRLLADAFFGGAVSSKTNKQIELEDETEQDGSGHGQQTD